jgi:hypothetical protein
MTLLVEDGTGLADAESYLSVADADAYHLKMGNSDAWGDADNKEAALRQACEFMQNRYLGLWQGVAYNVTQRLDWPRWGVVTRNRNVVGITTIPDTVKAAQAELAIRTLVWGNELLPDSPLRISKQVTGPIETTYDLSSSPNVEYLRIDAMLQEFLTGSPGGANMQMVRQ